MSARTGAPVADVAVALHGVHSRVLSRAEPSLGIRGDAVPVRTYGRTYGHTPSPRP
ncbi:hypothetical protein [Streptomyces sp. BK79]|uniref:hypothetical protein n=1 Tax=Streptomyces sp. BK79 TaxID=3350097 RepID=UPI00376F4C50